MCWEGKRCVGRVRGVLGGYQERIGEGEEPKGLPLRFLILKGDVWC